MALRLVRAVRTLLILGPWRPWVVRFLQSRSATHRCARSGATLFPDASVSSFVEKMELTGLAVGLQLPGAVIEAIVDYSRQAGDSITGHMDCAPIRQLVFDPVILDVASAYLRSEAIFFSSYLFTTNPHSSKSPHYAERFHYDVADYKSIQVYFYLSDVDELSGAHSLIEGTHRHKTVIQMLRPTLSDELAGRQFGARIRTVTGPEGSGFFEDQAAFHKRGVCTRPRLALILSYHLQRRPGP